MIMIAEVLLRSCYSCLDAFRYKLFFDYQHSCITELLLVEYNCLFTDWALKVVQIIM